ncbi:MAG: hypothetical protein UT05_C0003G0086 [Parcubacteria group bacterium GW2011_GWF2_38_76]|nr:MAG: hypothetical protein UT05_C0003G0086 [Parcubacteria group bacterium GW2011_GWF2_38_76]HBM46141.1 hypothetical protein [Patescibacteria group bacterium]
MRKTDEKFKIVFKNISILLFIVAFSIYPTKIFAQSILPSGTGLDQFLSGNFNADGAKQFLELIRRQAADAVSNMPIISNTQTNFENNLAKYRSFLDQLGGQGKNIGDLLNLAQSISPANVGSQISQIQGLVSTITSFKGGGGASDILNVFSQLESLGVPGFSQANNEITKGISNLGSIDKGITDIAKEVTNISSAASELQSAQQTLQNLKTFGGSSSEAIKKAEGAVADAQKKLNDIVGSTEQKAGGFFDQVNNVADTEAISDEFQTAGLPGEGKEQSVCDKPSPGVTGGGGGNGVPVIEQPGPLLDLTGKLVDFTSNIRTINKETCKKIEQLWKKEFELDKKVKEKSQETLEKIKKELKEFREKGRKASNDLKAEKSFYPTISEFIKEETEAARNKHLNQLEKTKVNDKVKEVFKKQNELDKNDSASYLARVSPTIDTEKVVEQAKEQKGATYFDSLKKIADPRNNISGQYLIQLSEKQTMEATAAKNAQDEYVSGQGIIGTKKCIKTIKTDSGEMCTEWEIITPAKLFGGLQEEAYKDNFKQTANADDISHEAETTTASGEKKKISNLAEDYTKDIAESSGAEGSGPGGTEGGGSNYTNNNSTVNTGGDTINEIINEGGGGDGGFDLLDLISQIVNMGDSEEPESSTPISIPPPTVSFNTTNNGMFSTKLNWSANGAVSCRATNDWITYLGFGIATTASEILIQKDEEIETDASYNIEHPSAFSFAVNVTGGNRVIPGQILQPATTTVTKEATGLKQTINYIPNITGVIDGDIFSIYINSDQIITVSYSDGDTQADLVAKIKSAMDSVNPTTEKGKIYSAITKTINQNTLTLTKTVPNIPASAIYELACKNTADKETTKKVTIEFFK